MQLRPKSAIHVARLAIDEVDVGGWAIDRKMTKPKSLKRVFIYSITGIMLCAWWFYRKELSPPIQVLADATKHLREQDLDFMVDYNRNDELGRFCTAFEEMYNYYLNYDFSGILILFLCLYGGVAPLSVKSFCHNRWGGFHNGNDDAF